MSLTICISFRAQLKDLFLKEVSCITFVLLQALQKFVCNQVVLFACFLVTVVLLYLELNLGPYTSLPGTLPVSCPQPL